MGYILILFYSIPLSRSFPSLPQIPSYFRPLILNRKLCNILPINLETKFTFGGSFLTRM